MMKKKADEFKEIIENARAEGRLGELLEAAEVTEKHPFFLAYYISQGYLQMEPAQLLAFLVVNVLRVERKGFAKQLGISTARLSQYANGIDHVPDKRRRELATLALAAADAAEGGFQEYEKESPQTYQMKRIVGSLIRTVVREVHDLVEMELLDLVQKGVISSEDTAA